MKKLLIILAIICLCIIGAIIFISSVKDASSINRVQDSLEEGEDVTLIQEKPIEENIADEREKRKEIVQKKIETIKKRLALKGLIIAGDSYYREDKLPAALQKYLEFYKQNPEDDLIKRKLANTYFALHKYGSALNYYKKIQDITPGDTLDTTISLLYSHDLSNPEKLTDIQMQLDSFPLSSEELFYYKNSLSCIKDFHACKLAFGEYFWPINKSGDTQEREVTFAPLQRIKDSIENYKNFQIDEVYLKDAYLIGAWYGDKLYPLSILLGGRLLEEKQGYKPILKIVAQSYFEMGKYKEARNTFGQYYEIDNSDPAVSYLLGIINVRLREYVLANIYFSKALELGYTPSIDIRRRMIHNFYMIESDKNMLQGFSDLIKKEKDFDENDLGLAIYYHILNEKYDPALKWSRQGQKLFPENTNFYAYQGWIHRMKGNTEGALEILKKGEVIDGKNPFILINMAYVLQTQGFDSQALSYFRKIAQYTPESEFTPQAQENIDILSKNQ